ncbi:hypothetical protein [Paractinoplanes maris]|uniref:hypothetical protein n=1 Tax=Paractinoplanes maris TaxID=1734446 RepID=UPI0020219EE3|nr:hypothetical protein [Actinoplanes maris]
MTGAEFSEVDIDLLADYIGGALEGTPEESAVATLIAENPGWREAYERLGGGVALVRAELGRFEPEPMPSDLAARLDGMFSAPALTLVKGDAAAERPGSRRRWTTPIAIAAGFIAFVGFGADYLSGRNASHDDSASSVAGTSEQAAPAAGTTILSTGTDYTRSTLASGPPQPLAAGDNASASTFGENSVPNQSRTSAKDPALARLTASAALQECFEAIERENAGGPIGVLTADYARFDGVPALIVRFTAENGDWVWATGADCGTPVAGADAIDKVPVR